MCVSPHIQDVTPLHPLQQLVLVPGHLQSVSQFLLSQSQPGQQGKNPGVFHIDQVKCCCCCLLDEKAQIWHMSEWLSPLILKPAFLQQGLRKGPCHCTSRLSLLHCFTFPSSLFHSQLRLVVWGWQRTGDVQGKSSCLRNAVQTSLNSLEVTRETWLWFYLGRATVPPTGFQVFFGWEVNFQIIWPRTKELEYL